jgi:DNA polymerase III alpha subunit
MTLEDETGFVNVIVWARVFAAHEAVAKAASLVEVRGVVQTENGVTNLVAEALVEPTLRHDLGPPRGKAQARPHSRDFH